MWHVRGRGDIYKKFWWGNLMERVHLKHLDIDERIILE
jgi:hypothetical protein